MEIFLKNSNREIVSGCYLYRIYRLKPSSFIRGTTRCLKTPQSGLHQGYVFIHSSPVSILQEHAPPLMTRQDLKNKLNWVCREDTLNHHLVTTFPEHLKDYNENKEFIAIVRDL